MDTDRIMVAITAVYAIATIFITISNIVSADASRKQVKESRIQFDEMRRLSSLPFLQIELNGKKIVQWSIHLNCQQETSLQRICFLR